MERLPILAEASRLTVIERGRTTNGELGWLVECECGRRWVVRSDAIKKQKTCSDCLYKYRPRKHGDSRKHGGGSYLTYVSWMTMRKRVKQGYRDCDADPRWNDYRVFLADMGRRPSDKHTLDRIDNLKGYWPENCKWSTKKEQSNNRDVTIWLEHEGELLPLSVLAVKAVVSYQTFRRRIAAGWDVETALTKPSRKG